MLIDFHSHILPGADHGCYDLEMALQQLEMASEACVEIIIATPHYTPYLETVEAFLERRNESYKRLSIELTSHQLPQVIPGSEVLLYPGIDRLPDIELLCAVNTGCILIEMPLTVWGEDLIETLEKLKKNKNMNVVIAHIDRYRKEDVEKLIELDLLLQINAAGLCSLNKRHWLKSMIDNPNVVALGSDIHGTQIGYKQFSKALKILGDSSITLMERSRELIGARGKVEEKYE